MLLQVVVVAAVRGHLCRRHLSCDKCILNCASCQSVCLGLSFHNGLSLQLSPSLSLLLAIPPCADISRASRWLLLVDIVVVMARCCWFAFSVAGGFDLFVAAGVVADGVVCC